MRIAADTNVLVRLLTDDDPCQKAIAEAELDGRRLGASVFISFDRKAVRLLGDRGEAVRLP